MNRYFLFFFLLLFVIQNSNSQQKGRISKREYIDQYKGIAIDEMKRSGIPASIILAQGMLESDNGNSRLTKEGNNHFGIKCHNWDGKEIYEDDDQKNECFRKYNSSAESFHDHTNFLLTKQRYNFLFSYKSSDYKSWARGLKKAGYATNPQYDEMLIKIIEDNQLYVYDSNVGIVKKHTIEKNTENSTDGFTFSIEKPIYKRNDIEYVVAKNGDTFDKIAKEMDMFSWELILYNELSKDSILHEGQILYLHPKHRKAAVGQDYHTVQAGESLYSISQLYGIKTRLLRKWNNLSKKDSVHEGEVLNLRFKKKK